MWAGGSAAATHFRDGLATHDGIAGLDQVVAVMRVKRGIAIAVVNLTLLTAWLVPTTVMSIAICFVSTYLYSLVTAGYKWLRSRIE